MTSDVGSPNVVPSTKWTIARRMLKYSFLASLLGAMSLIVVAWVRSSTWNDRVELDVVKDQVVLFKSKQGELTVGVFQMERGPFHSLLQQLKETWMPGVPRPMRHFSFLLKQPLLEPEKSFVTFKEKIKETKASIGAGIVSQIQVFETHHPPLNWTMSPNTYLDTGYSGHGIVLPHWMLLSVLGTIFTAIVLGRKFTLRAFFIWVTIACVLLAIAVRTREVPNDSRSVAPQRTL